GRSGQNFGPGDEGLQDKVLLGVRRVPACRAGIAPDRFTTAVAGLRPTEIVGFRQGIGTILHRPQTPRRGEARLATASLELEPAAEYPLSPSSCPWSGGRRHN